MSGGKGSRPAGCGGKHLRCRVVLEQLGPNVGYQQALSALQAADADVGEGNYSNLRREVWPKAKDLRKRQSRPPNYGKRGRCRVLLQTLGPDVSYQQARLQLLAADADIGATNYSALRREVYPDAPDLRRRA